MSAATQNAIPCPVLLLPIRLETRFFPAGRYGYELRVRLFPDEIHLHTLDRKITPEESADAKGFFDLPEKDRQERWQTLVSKYGAYRAQWLVWPIGGGGGTFQSEYPTFHWAPDYFYVYLYRSDGTFIWKRSRQVQQSALVAFSEGKYWMNDYEQALAIGMAVTFSLQELGAVDEKTVFPKIIAVGMQDRGNEILGDGPGPRHRNKLCYLFQNHQATEGFSFLPYGAPTNNIEDSPSAYNSDEEYDAAGTYDHVTRRKTAPGSANERLCRALDLHISTFAFVKNADDAPPPIYNFVQRASWFAMGGYLLHLLLGDQASRRAHDWLWRHYGDYVKACGPYPAVQIGDQPYGVLPVMHLRDRTPSSGQFSQSAYWNTMRENLSAAMEQWLETLEKDQIRVPRLEDSKDALTELATLLSQHPASVQHQIRVLELSRIKGRLAAWLQRDSGLNEPLAERPIMQVYSSLSNHPEVEAEAQEIFERQDYFTHLFFGRHWEGLSGKTIRQLLNFPFYAFFDHSHYLINEPPEEPGEVILDLPFSKSGEWAHDGAFANYIRDLKELIGTNDPYKVKVLKEENSFLIDVLFDSFARTIRILGREALPKLVELGENLIAEFRQYKNDFDQTQQLAKRTFSEALDLNSFRLDAWITSLATRRIEETRRSSQAEAGVRLGAYGWVENLRLSKTSVKKRGAEYWDTADTDGGIIHAPTSAQAVASAAFKNAFLTRQEEERDNPFALKLTSDRIQKGLMFLDGLRTGQSLETLLGRRLENWLREENLSDVIYNLREQYPMDESIITSENGERRVNTQMTIMDGFKMLQLVKNKESLARAEILKILQDAKYSGQKKERAADNILKQVKKLENLIDSAADLLLYEAGYQITQGNYSQAAAAADLFKSLDTSDGDEEEQAIPDPPKLDALKTNVPGVSISHQLAQLFETPPENRYRVDQALAYAEPVLEYWLSQQVGGLEAEGAVEQRIGCNIRILERDKGALLHTVQIELSDLGIGYLDLMYLSDVPAKDQVSALETRMANHAFTGWQKHEKPPKASLRFEIDDRPDRKSLSEALEVLRMLRQIVAQSSVLSFPAEKLEEALEQKRKLIDPIKERVVHLRDVLLFWKEAIDLSRLRNFHLPHIQAVMRDAIEFDREKLEKEAGRIIETVDKLLRQYEDAKNAAEAFELLKTAMQTFFGSSFILLAPCQPPDILVKAIKEKTKQKHLIGDDDLSWANGQNLWGQERVYQWLQGLAEVDTDVALFEEWLMLKNIWRTTHAKEEVFYIYQEPTGLDYPWVALSQEEILTLADQYSLSFQEDDESFPDKNRRQIYPDGTDSMVLHAPKDMQIDRAKPLYGIVIDAFTEHIPDKKIQTGLSFQYNGPNNEAPQSLLLVAPSNAVVEKGEWDVADLRDAVFDTLDLAKIRMMDLETIEGMGFLLPMMYWLNIPGER